MADLTNWSLTVEVLWHMGDVWIGSQVTWLALGQSQFLESDPSVALWRKKAILTDGVWETEKILGVYS